LQELLEASVAASVASALAAVVAVKEFVQLEA
jgi:hypothetical protein